MIVTKAPLRISLFGGGSDLPAYFSNHKAAVLSTTIDKFNYVIGHNTPYRTIKILYDEFESIDSLEAINHKIIKHTLKHFNVTEGITIASISDVPSQGSGMGSSSSFTVALIDMLRHYTGINVGSSIDIAKLACHIEIDLCNYNIGYQDQFAAAMQGFNLFEFSNSGHVTTTPITTARPEIKERLKELNDSLVLVYTGIKRDKTAGEILADQVDQLQSDVIKQQCVARNVERAYHGYDIITSGNQPISVFGELLHDAWCDKKQLSEHITNDHFNHLYHVATANGAIGGKLLGAGGGGFFLFYAKQNSQKKMIRAINETFPAAIIYPFRFENVV